MPIDSQDFLNRVVPALKEKIDLNDKSLVDKAAYKASGIWKEITNKNLYDDIYEKESMGALHRTPERTVLKENSLRDGWQKRAHKVKYAALATFSEETKHFDRWDIISDLTKGLAQARPYTYEIIAVSVLEYGHMAAGSVPTVGNVPVIDSIGADGNPLFFGAHPFKSDPSHTWSNRSSSLLAFNRTNIQSVSDIVEDWRLSNDALTNIKVDKLIIPRTMRWAAHEIFKSDKQPETGNNAKNAIHEAFGSDDYYVYEWLTSSTDWYAMTSVETDFKFRIAAGWESKTATWVDHKIQAEFMSRSTMFSADVHNGRKLYKVCA